MDVTTLASKQDRDKRYPGVSEGGKTWQAMDTDGVWLHRD